VVQDHLLNKIERAQEKAFSGASWSRLDAADVISVAVKTLAAVVRRNAKVLRTLVLRGAVDERVLARGSESTLHLYEQFNGVLLQHSGELLVKDPDVAIDVCFRMVYATLIREVTHGGGLRFAACPQLDAARQRAGRHVQRLPAATDRLLTCPPGNVRGT
jgi:hypothetical protein